MTVLEKGRFPGVWEDEEGSLFTRNLVPSVSVYGERLFFFQGAEYRQWNIRRSKLGAYVAKKPREFPFSEITNVLYLGAANGTTCSHVSDLCPNGKIFAVEFSRRVFRDLLDLSSRRKNLFPILEDARHPERYAHIVPRVDVVFQDIAQRDQTEIFARNIRAFLRKGGSGLLSLKARSVDFAREPAEIFAETQNALQSVGSLVESRELAPFEMDHAMFHVRI